MMESSFWNKKRVLITGHTGFKGSWLSLWLNELGAVVHGYALDPPTDPSLYRLASVQDIVRSTIADVRDGTALSTMMRDVQPDIVVHMAAQPLVRDSYKVPVETYATNVMGTVNLLEAVRSCGSVRAVVNVTTDKCYENREWVWGYRENEPLGGYDPYSSSKACSEIVTAAYRSSYFSGSAGPAAAGIATARAGNVIGGGDWASDRLVPDLVRAILRGEPVRIRNPRAIRPWQHVLDPLRGYLLLAQKLYETGQGHAGAWNFGPDDQDAKTVEWIVRTICEKWGKGASYAIEGAEGPHEAFTLKLDTSKARSGLGWQPVWSIDRAIDSIIEWTRTYVSRGDIRKICLAQIGAYTRSIAEVQGG